MKFDGAFVLFVGRTSLLLERPDAEAVITSLAAALFRPAGHRRVADRPRRAN
jgi:hypothetical protein